MFALGTCGMAATGINPISTWLLISLAAQSEVYLNLDLSYLEFPNAQFRK